MKRISLESARKLDKLCKQKGVELPPPEMEYRGRLAGGKPFYQIDRYEIERGVAFVYSAPAYDIEEMLNIFNSHVSAALILYPYEKGWRIKCEKLRVNCEVNSVSEGLSLVLSCGVRQGIIKNKS